MRTLRRPPVLAPLLALFGFALVGCGGWPENPNLVLISIDSLRADRLGIYGHERDTSPHLDRLAAEAVVFDIAYSTTSWTLPSHVSMLTGLYPEVHGVMKGKQRTPQEAVLVSEVLQAADYRTAAVISGPYLTSRFGFAQGWDEDDDETIRFGSTPRSHRGTVTPRQHERILEVVEELGEGPFFLFLHYWDVHLDYSPPPPYDTLFDPDYEGEIDGSGFLDDERIHAGMDPRDLEHLLALYDGEVALTDEYLGRLFDELRRRGLYEDSLIVVTSDHGDEFFEHGEKGHRTSLFNETLRVPLIVRFPGGRWGGRRVEKPVSVVDIAPTLLEVAGLEPPPLTNGRSLAGPAGGRRGRERFLFADLHDTHKAVMRGKWKLIVAPSAENDPDLLFRLDEDPGETENLAADLPDRQARLRRALADWLGVAERQRGALGREEIEYDEETRRTLEALGYVD